MLKKKCTGITLCILFISDESLILSMAADFYLAGLIAPWSGHRCFFNRGFIAAWTSNGGTGTVHPVITNG